MLKKANHPWLWPKRGKLWEGAMPGSTLAKAGPLQKVTRLELAVYYKKKNKKTNQKQTQIGTTHKREIAHGGW